MYVIMDRSRNGASDDRKIVFLTSERKKVLDFVHKATLAEMSGIGWDPYIYERENEVHGDMYEQCLNQILAGKIYFLKENVEYPSYEDDEDDEDENNITEEIRNRLEEDQRDQKDLSVTFYEEKPRSGLSPSSPAYALKD